MLQWRFTSFDELTVREVHDLYQARVAVFVVEQNCPFQDFDGLDPGCWHLLGRAPDGLLLAYCRLVPPGLKYAQPSIGRVLTTKEARGSGAGRELMAKAVGHAEHLWPGRAIRIGAQRYLERFYGGFGFAKSSEPYDEDGIVHIEMMRPAAAV
ncbi:MAG: GNAT family N-acetyltransferase [Pseudomonadota bacterium]|nr:GNAT family N-acetyltransferase [Pseudomonadota bacterium]